MLKIRGLSRPGLAPCDLDVAAGEAVALLGPSGSGKTIFLRAIADLDPNEGSVFLDDAARGQMPAPQWRRQVIYLAAEPGWWADTPAAHFEDPDAALALLPALGLPSEVLRRPLAVLSTGERHRLALVRALLRAPRVLLLDEPTSGLDPDSAVAVEAILRERLGQGAAILFSTHDSAQAARLARRRLRIAGGTISGEGS
ncbi:MAG: ABC transporter ATP-binding protein [bacterium]|nr:ABC transporter ATP-binding protein [bacterium]